MKATIIATTLALASTQLSAILVIDSFEGGVPTLTVTSASPTDTFSDLSPANSAFANRDFTLGLTSSTGIDIITELMLASDGSLSLDYLTSSTGTGEASIVYSGGGFSGGFDITTGGNDRFGIDVLESNPGGDSSTPLFANLGIRVLDTLGETATISTIVDPIGLYTFEFTAFESANSSLDLTSVAAVTLLFDNNDAPAADFALDYLRIGNSSTVPEPSAYAAIAGLLALGLVAARRRSL